MKALERESVSVFALGVAVYPLPLNASASALASSAPSVPAVALLVTFDKVTERSRLPVLVFVEPSFQV